MENKIIILENEFFKLEIDSFGAQLKSIFSKKQNKNILWSGDEKFWGKTSPILFPIVGELKNGFFDFDSNQYFLPRHGFAREKIFELVFHNASEAKMVLSSDIETKKVFPFDFEFCVSHRLEKDKIFIDFEVKNTGNILYFSLGAHPAFATENISQRQIKFSHNQNLERYFLDGGLVGRSEKFLENENSFGLSNSLFEDDALVFKKGENIWEKLFLENKKSGEKIIFDISQSKYLGIWSAKNSPFVCIEPWRGLADNTESDNDFTKKEGIIALQKGEIFSTGYNIQI